MLLQKEAKLLPFEREEAVVVRSIFDEGGNTSIELVMMTAVFGILLAKETELYRIHIIQTKSTLCAFLTVFGRCLDMCALLVRHLNHYTPFFSSL